MMLNLDYQENALKSNFILIHPIFISLHLLLLLLLSRFSCVQLCAIP